MHLRARLHFASRLARAERVTVCRDVSQGGDRLARCVAHGWPPCVAAGRSDRQCDETALRELVAEIAVRFAGEPHAGLWIVKRHDDVQAAGRGIDRAHDGGWVENEVIAEREVWQ